MDRDWRDDSPCKLVVQAGYLSSMPNTYVKVRCGSTHTLSCQHWGGGVSRILGLHLPASTVQPMTPKQKKPSLKKQYNKNKMKQNKNNHHKKTKTKKQNTL